MNLLRQLPAAGLIALPGALTVYFAFSAGGYSAGTTATVALALALLLILQTTLDENAFAGFGRALTLAAGALAVYAAFALASGAWSGAPSRALLEFDRALLYLLAVVLMGSTGSLARRMPWIVRGLAAALVVVSVVGLLSRVLPELVPVPASEAGDRLSYPVTYWNAQGLLASLGIVLCFHLASSEREPAAARVLGAAALPALAATLVFTFSRGAIAVALAGLVVYALLARPRALVSGILTGGVAGAIGAVVAYRAELLATEDFTSPAALAQGGDAASTLLACAVGAAVLRILLLPVDARVARLSLPPRFRLTVWVAAVGVSLAAVLAASVAVDLPARVGEQYEVFVAGNAPVETGPRRERLTSAANNRRLDQWKVALEAYDEARVGGQGAGTFQLLWARLRPTDFNLVDGHSLYLETLAELGLVGLALLAIALGAILVGLAARARGPDRHLYAALLAAALAWLVHAGVDWDWEMPVTAIWLFLVGGAALAARPSGHRRIVAPGRFARVVIGLGLLVLALTPGLILISQSNLDESARALRAGDCPSAIDAALNSIAAVGVRPEPYELMGYCDARLGFGRLGVQALEAAVRRDPDNWEFRYGLALVRGASGFDPRPDAQAALRLDPFNPLTRVAVERFATDDPREWERVARQATLSIP